MGDQANLVIVASMRDEASPKLKQMTNQVQQTSQASADLRMTLTASGAALSAIGGLLARMDNPLAKTASNFLVVSGAIMTTASAIMTMMPMLKNLIASLRTLAVTQALLQAFSGPGGWIALGVGAAAGAGITAGVMASSRGGGGGTTIQNINVQGSVISERELGDISRKHMLQSQDRNGTTGFK